jgi:NADH-quinone oxidoreductase subunit B
MEGLQLLQHVVGTERRPLSWVVGDQTVHRPTAPSMRDLKRDGRRRVTELREPNGV